MINKAPQKQPKIEELSQDEINSFFEEVNRGGRTFSPSPTPEYKDIASGWITTSGSSNKSNKLIKVSAWQTGQAS